ncbi:hypothetical protein ACJZ2D_009717 [Fusarium nematophilum]
MTCGKPSFSISLVKQRATTFVLIAPCVDRYAGAASAMYYLLADPDTHVLKHVEFLLELEEQHRPDVCHHVYNTTVLHVVAELSSMSLSDAEPVEQLFLDLPVHQVLQRDGVPAVEPWASLYIDAIHDGRFGDAIWARYHIMGDVIDGMIEGLTVLESITEDAVGYKKYAPEQYAEAVSFYRGTVSSADGHADVIEVILRVDGEDVTGKYVPEGG